MNDFTSKTLGELLSHPNETIRRNAISILKTLQRLAETAEDKQAREHAEVLREIERDSRQSRQ